MTAQRLLKFLAFIAVAAGLAALWEWRTEGFVTDSWLIQVCAGALLAALVVGLTGQETRPRAMLRFLAGVAALIAVIALVADFSRPGSGFTSLSGHLSQLAPSVLAAVRSGVAQTLGDSAWNNWGAPLFALPTFILFFLISAICGYASRRRHKVRVFVN